VETKRGEQPDFADHAERTWCSHFLATTTKREMLRGNPSGQGKEVWGGNKPSRRDESERGGTLIKSKNRRVGTEKFKKNEKRQER